MIIHIVLLQIIQIIHMTIGRAKHNRTYCSYCCTIRRKGHAQFIQRARPVVSTEQTMQSTPGYSTLPYVSGPLSMAPLPYAAYTAPLLFTAPMPYAAMPAMSARTPFPMGYYGQGNRFPLICLTPVGCLRESRCYNISSFRNGSNLKLGELAKPSLSPPLVHRGSQLRLGTMLRSLQGGQPVLRGLD